MQEDYIDLRVYIDILLRRRRIIALFAVLLTLVAFLYSQLTPPVYQSVAGLLVAPKRADLRLTTVLSLSAEDGQRVDLRYRNAALLEVAGSLDIAQRVIDKHSDLAKELRASGPQDLADRVDVTGKDDWVSIKASAPTAQQAAQLASAWVHEVENQINTLYAPDASTEVNLTVEAETAMAKYAADQAALEAFLSQSQRADLEGQIQALRASLDLTTVDVPLANAYRQEGFLQQLLLDAEALKQRVQHDTGSPDNDWGVAMSYIALQLQAFGGQSAGHSLQQRTGGASLDLMTQAASPVNWYLDLSAEPPAVTVNDAENLINILEGRLRLVQEELALSSSQSAVTQARAIDISQIAGELTALQLQLEIENARLRELTSARDASWQTYLALVNKLREVQVESAVAIKEVQIASEPLPPSRPSAPSRMTNMAIGVMSGLLLGTVWALGQAYLGKQMDIDARSRLGRWLLNASGLPNYSPRGSA